ncbi:MAG TPA: glucose 1-dehydrogenase [Hyphomicrobiaceae bacterium]|nr:glucose 1-dehydrogenase [Hyphomicrobiaceae bacterium]
MDFSGKVAVITGGANGIGAATSKAFAAAGAKVAVVDVNEKAAQACADAIKASGGTAIAIGADVTSSADCKAYVDRVVAEYGTIDCFHNNAGIEGTVTPTAEYDEAVFDAVIGVNIKGVFLGLRHVLPVMIANGGGAIVNTASVAGLTGTPGMPAYCASKHAVLGITKTVAGEVARQGIRVNAICPGPVETRMIQDLQKQINPGEPATVKARYEASIPSGRYSTPEEIARTVLFLCSEHSDNITGAHFVIDGGRTATGGAVTMVTRSAN